MKQGISKEEREETERIEAFLKEEKKKYLALSAEPKLLILGTSDSGKSTLLKQLKILHGKGFTEEERSSAKLEIKKAVLSACNALLNECDDQLQQNYLDLSFYCTSFIDLNEPFTNYAIRNILQMWKEPQVIEKYNLLVDKLIPRTTERFIEEVERIGARNYHPTNNDILLLRTVTQTVSDTVFEFSKVRIHFYDVSGLQHHRKQWISYFEDVTAILFVVALSSYDQTLTEDPSVNRMADAISLFDQISNHPLLVKPDIILFFNKKDIYEKKILKSNIVNYFPEYKGKAGSFSQGYSFFKKTFIAIPKAQKKTLYVHLTCCTDTETMKTICSNLFESIIKRDASEFGLI
ncbi:Guanine nucleotide-binding protein G(o) subunit alpha [Boothiomyces sp. JEL0838]|nr:Guanine nucleotide-binding protein G(o) subunit alpha [Boothiomyces sp. JEL0838]